MDNKEEEYERAKEKKVGFTCYGEVLKMLNYLKNYYGQLTYTSTLRIIITEHFRIIIGKQRKDGES